MTPGGPLGVQNIEKLTLIIEKGLYNITFSLIRFRGSGSAAQAARPLPYPHKELGAKARTLEQDGSWDGQRVHAGG